MWLQSFVIICDAFLILFPPVAPFIWVPSPASLRSELNHIHASAIEHLRQTHHQESAAAKMELEKTLDSSRTQVGPSTDGWSCIFIGWDFHRNRAWYRWPCEGTSRSAGKSISVFLTAHAWSSAAQCWNSSRWIFYSSEPGPVSR